MAENSQPPSSPKESFLKEIPKIFKSIHSPDAPTRKASFLFLFSFFSLFVTLTSGIGVILNKKYQLKKLEEKRQKENQFEKIENDFDQVRIKNILFLLGSFTLDLKNIPNRKRIPGVLNMAELEIVLLCDSKETHKFLEKNQKQAQSEVTNLFILTDREELMASAGKRRIKKIILHKLNEWLPHGKIEEVYFSKLIIN